MTDLRFYFDPVCPFAWMTSKWVREVAAQKEYVVEWRFISLRLLNAKVDYAAQFPEDYERGHTAGLRLLRVCAKVRDELGQDAVARAYEAMGSAVFEVDHEAAKARDAGDRGTEQFAADALTAAGLDAAYAAAVDDDSWDAVVQAETDEALGATGKDVGTPIIWVDPPDGVAFFGPVISRLPSPEQAVELWDHVVGLARFAGFAELKRSLRELPQLPALGVAAGDVGKSEDWHGGSRRQHK